YQSYIAYLNEKKHLDPAFYPFELDSYDLALVDEAQDLSHKGLKSVYSCTKNNAVLFCMDSHQRLRGNKSVRPYLLQMVGNEDTRHVTLETTYRCPLKVVEA